MLTVLAEPAPRSGDDIPGVVLVGIMIGIVLIVAAIQFMFDKKKK